MNEALITTVAQIVSAVCIMLIGVAGAWLTAKIGKQQQLAAVKAATEQVVEAAQLTVGELQQTVVEKLKAAGGGKLTDAQVAELGKLLKAVTSIIFRTFYWAPRRRQEYRRSSSACGYVGNAAALSIYPQAVPLSGLLE